MQQHLLSTLPKTFSALAFIILLGVGTVGCVASISPPQRGEAELLPESAARQLLAQQIRSAYAEKPYVYAKGFFCDTSKQVPIRYSDVSSVEYYPLDDEI